MTIGTAVGYVFIGVIFYLGFLDFIKDVFKGD